MPLDQPPAVIDGDTFTIGAETLRIEGIDAPEMRAKCDSERFLALVARAKLAELIRDPSLSIQRGKKDRYGRTLARIRVQGQDGGEILIRAFLAVPWKGRRHDWCG